MRDVSADDSRRRIAATAAAKMDLHEFAEATRIIISNGLSVAKRLQ